MAMDFRDWPVSTGADWTWLVNDDAIVPTNGFRRQSASGYTFPDLLVSASLVVCKPGYGIFTEAVATNTPILYLSRVDWPEEPYLVQWASQHVYCKALRIEDLLSGDFTRDIDAALASEKKPNNNDITSEFRGEHQVCDLLDQLLSVQ